MTIQRLGAVLVVLLLGVLTLPWWMPAGPRNAQAVQGWESSEESSVQGRAVIDALTFERDELPSATSWFNQGVAWQASGDPARAIAAYRAAGRLSPRSPDIVHNLATARAELEGNPPPPVGTSPGWTAILTPGELGVVGLLLSLAAAGALLQTRRRGTSAMPGCAALLAAMLASGVAWSGRNSALDERVAVVLDEAVVRDGAAIDAGQRHVLPRGSEVRVERVRGEFALVEDGKQRRGWVLREALEAPRL